MGSKIATEISDWRKKHNADGKPRRVKERQISQLRMAELAGVSVGCLQAAESNTRKTGDEQLTLIARLMGKTLEELKSGDSDDHVLVQPDPRGEGLRGEDYAIAQLFHHASTDVRLRVRTQLHADAEGEALPRTIDLPVHHPAQELLAALVRRLADLPTERLTQLEAWLLADHGHSAEPVEALLDRVRQRLLADPAYPDTLTQHLDLLDARVTPPAQPQKKHRSAQKRRA